MSDRYWDSVKEHIGNPKLELGPQFAYQALYTPRHLAFVFSRYKFAAKLLSSRKQARVLELGCGEGIGALLLAEDGHSVVGVDFDKEAIEYAKSKLNGHHDFDLQFLHGDIIDMNLGLFNAVVSLDVIEHIPQEEEEGYVQTICDHLDEDGFCCIGTPNITAHQYASEMSKRGHINMFSSDRFLALFQKYFKNAFIFGMNDEVVHTGYPAMCHYLMVLACGKK